MILRATVIAVTLALVPACTGGEEKQPAEAVEMDDTEPSEPGPASEPMKEPMDKAKAAPAKMKGKAKAGTGTAPKADGKTGKKPAKKPVKK